MMNKRLKSIAKTSYATFILAVNFQVADLTVL